MSHVDIRPITGADVRPARSMLARTFDDDPPSRWLFPAPRRRVAALRLVMGAAVVDAKPFGHVHVATERDGRIVGLAAWLPPRAYPPDGMRLVRQSLSVAAIAPMFPGTVRKGSALLARMQKVHPKEEHWYLVLLGVDPSRQGQGIGSALVSVGLATADGDGRPAYLETAKERNLAFYRRHGFDVVDALTVSDSPTMWTMWRDPA